MCAVILESTSGPLTESARLIGVLRASWLKHWRAQNTATDRPPVPARASAATAAYSRRPTATEHAHATTSVNVCSCLREMLKSSARSVFD
jgi:hypothetical protein